MPGYFKLKRPFATKTESLPEGEMKDIIKTFRLLEQYGVMSANTARRLKVTLKQCISLEAKKEKEKNDVKKNNLEEQIEQQKIKLTKDYTFFASTALANDWAKNRKTIETFFKYLGGENLTKINNHIKQAKDILDGMSKALEAAENQN